MIYLTCVCYIFYKSDTTAFRGQYFKSFELISVISITVHFKLYPLNRDSYLVGNRVHEIVLFKIVLYIYI